MMSYSVAENIELPDETTGTLLRLLSRLSAQTSDLHDDKRGAAAGRACLLQTLLYEIDETILPRHLTLYFDHGAVAELKICHRRLLSLDLIDGPGQSPVAHETAVQTYLWQLLTLEAAYKDTGFRIKRRACDTVIETESCSARQLVDALASQQHDSRLNRFLGLVNTGCFGWVLFGDDTSNVKCSGPDALVHQLTDLARADAAARQTHGQALRIPDAAPSFMVLSMHGETRVIVARDHSETLLLALPAHQLTTASLAWHGIFDIQRSST